MFRRSSALAREFVAVARELAPDVDAKVVSRDTVRLARAGGGQVACSLDALKRECAARGDDTGRAALIRHYAAAMLRNLEPLPDVVDLAHVLPLLKPAGWAVAAQPDPCRRPVAVPIADIETVFVETVRGQLRFVASRHLDAGAFDADELGDRALANLDAAAATIELQRDDAGVLLASLPGRYTFNATLALSMPVWTAVERELGRAVCAMPERELCLFVPADDATALADLRRLAPGLFDNAGYPVSRNLYQRDADGLAVLPAR